jgi:hypothetical protein
MFMYSNCYVCSALCILFHCVVLWFFACKCVLYCCHVVCVNPIAVNKFITYQICSQSDCYVDIISYHRTAKCSAIRYQLQKVYHGTKYGTWIVWSIIKFNKNRLSKWQQYLVHMSPCISLTTKYTRKDKATDFES